MTEYIDTHTHAYDEAFAGCEDEVVARGVAAGVTVQLQADVDSRERERMFALVERHPGVLYPMLGLYPGSVDRDWRREIDALEAWRGRGIVAVGEIGLDYHYGKEFQQEQKEAFRIQLELASAWDLPVNIHLRDATEDFFAIIRDCAHLHLRGNLHAYAGSYETWRELCRYGEWSIGVGGVVTFKNAHLPEVVARVPLDRIVLETDAPYLAPAPFRGRRNESAYIPAIAAKVAEIKGVPVGTVEEATTDNAIKLFSL